MRSPEFRKHTGFIKRRSTQDSHEGSEEEPSSYRYYERPMNHPERYVYPSLARQYSLGNTNAHNRASPSDDKSSSEFDQFEMNSSLSSDFRAGTANVQKHRPTESSFSLSPYENSSEEQIELSAHKPHIPAGKGVTSSNFQRGTIREETSEDNPSMQESQRLSKEPVRHTLESRHHLLRNQQSKSKQRRTQKPNDSSEDDSERNSQSHNNRLREQKSRPSDAFKRHRFLEKSGSKVKSKSKYRDRSNQKSSESSSSFSLDSFADSPPKSKPADKKRVVPASGSDRLLIQPNQGIAAKHSVKRQQTSDKTATFSRPAQLKQQPAASQKLKPQQSDSSEEQLIVEYDTKDFKGGSIRDEILTTYYNKQREQVQQRNNSRPHLTQHSTKSPPKPSAVAPVKAHQKPKEEESSAFNSDDSSFSPSRKHKPEAFEVDVRAKLTLAEAFEARCGRLKERLEVEREEFKRGNIAKLYKKMREQQQTMQENDQNRENLDPKVVQRPFNRHAERLALGIKPLVNKKEMFKQTKKRYKQLPEVRHRLNEQKKRQDFARRMQNVKKLDRQVRLRLKYTNRP